MTYLRYSILLFFLFNLIVQMHCNNSKKELPSSEGSVDVAYQEMTQCTLYFYDQTRMTGRLLAEKMRKELEKNAKTIVTPVELVFFDSTGDTTTYIESDSGLTSGKMQDFTVWGNVFIRTYDNKKIKTHKLYWNSETHKVISDTFVTIITAKGDVMKGKNLDADENFNRWVFRESVSGEIREFRKRIESEDNFLE